MGVGDRIQEELRKRNMSQNKLAKAAQISQSGLSSIINGASSPKENTLQAIANALGISVAELILQGNERAGQPITAEQIMVAGTEPITEEAKILAKGIDKLPKAQREQALNVVRAMFTQYSDYFERTDPDAENS